MSETTDQPGAMQKTKKGRNYQTFQLPRSLIAPLQDLVDKDYMGFRSIAEIIAYLIRVFVDKRSESPITFSPPVL